MSGNWQHVYPPKDGTWCWVSDGVTVWLALRDTGSAGGWTNTDTWEDWHGEVRNWIPLEMPGLPVEGEGK
jgi:hypothetical protein